MSTSGKTVTDVPLELLKTLPVSRSKSSFENATPATSACSMAPVEKRAVRSVWLIAMKLLVSRTKPRGPELGFQMPAGEQTAPV